MEEILQYKDETPKRCWRYSHWSFNHNEVDCSKVARDINRYFYECERSGTTEWNEGISYYDIQKRGNRLNFRKIFVYDPTDPEEEEYVISAEYYH